MGKWGATKQLGSKVLGGMKNLFKSGGAIRAVGGFVGRGALAALPALASNPVGWVIGGALLAGAVAYGGYKLYKKLSQEDNHLTTFRMAQYGFKLSDEERSAKILNLEEYLSKYTSKATKSVPASISNQADSNKALEIMGVNQNSQEDVQAFFNWYFYRFKPVFYHGKHCITVK